MSKRKIVRMLVTVSAPRDMRLPAIRKCLREEMNDARTRFQHELFVRKVQGVTKITPRRPFMENDLHGFMESDRDFVLNNMDACVEFLERMTEGGG